MGDGSSPPVRLMSHTSNLYGDDATIHPLNSQHTLHQEPLARESMSTEWTDEKHSLYLKSMETSFVKDLYNSFASRGRRVCTSRQKHAANCTSYSQGKVLQSGCLKNIRLKSNGSCLAKIRSADPWIRHFRSTHGPQIRTSSTLYQKAVLAANLYRYDSVEVMDQNFVDDDDIGEKASHTCSTKRIKSSITSTPSNDQVVPSAKFVGAADLIDE